jgi:diguanylate cyclase (GGDEF)-like protein
MPVILRAAIRATGAAGGVILSGQKTVVSQGAVDSRAGTEIRIPLAVPESEPPAILALYPPEGGFNDEALDAANLISDQAGIALENARLHRLVERQAITDELTGLPNRRQFLAQLQLEVSRAERSGTPLALILADLDDFKQVNDTWGHAVGDQALRSFAAILRSTIREIDLPARLGGEEFAILLPDTDISGGKELAERIRHLLADSGHETTTGPARVTASFGVSCFPPIGTADELLIDADKNLYQAKQRGKNTVVASQNAGSQRFD